MRDELARKVSTLYIIGYTPKFPGTVASLAGLVLVMVTGTKGFLYFLFLSLSVITGFAVSGKTERFINRKDPKEIVIDELCGMLLSLFLVEVSPFNIVAGFIFFRAFDILKPFPIKDAEKLRGSAGIMLDDILSGLSTNLILRILEVRSGMLAY